MTAVMLFAASMVEAQRMGDNTYVVLGHGYAKDSENVYLNGQVLPWVDPHTFSLKRCDGHQSYRCFEKYVISHSDVFYDGKKLDDASASSFKDLGYDMVRIPLMCIFVARRSVVQVLIRSDC